jgi:surface polysaccharide O-acyltransferase-like enzyme
MNLNTPNPRLFYADWLRTLAIFAVVILHNSTDLANLYGKIGVSNWLAAAIYNGIFRFCVPLFVLLSGSLLLNREREITVRELFIKRLPKLIIPLVFWSVIYFLYAKYFTSQQKGAGFFQTLRTFYCGPVVFHFWFIYMMIGIYLVSPVLNIFISVAKQNYIEYFLAIWFITNCVFGIIEIAFEMPIGIDLNFYTGYTGYFLMGYYLQNFNFSARFTSWSILLGGGAICISVAGVILLHVYKINHANDLIESDFTPDIPLAVAGLFLWAKRYFKFGKATLGASGKLTVQISMESYGIYIIHVLVMDFIFTGVWAKYLSASATFWVIPFKAIVVLFLSYLVTRLLRFIPFSKYLI